MSAPVRTMSPREWIGDRPFPWPPTLGLSDGEEVVACFTVNQVTALRTRSNDAFLKLQLADAYGVVEARMWEGVEEVADSLRAGVYVGVRGSIERYHEERQLRVEELTLLSIELDDLVLFLPRSARPAEHMDLELAAIIGTVAEPGLRRLLDNLLGHDTETGHAFRLAPAAKQNHHAYLGGLIEHTLSMVTVCDMLAAHYGNGIDRDLLIAGALLHDIGKVREIGARGGFPYTDEGKLLGHILIGLQMVAAAAAAVPELHPARVMLLQHLIASHQGRYEWQSPREPRTLEAVILHYADDLDAKVNQASSLIGAVSTGWTAYDRSFGRDFLRHIPDDAPPAPVRTATPQQASQQTPQQASQQTPQQASQQTSQQASQQAPGPDASGPVAAARDVSTRDLDTLDLFEDK